MHTMVGGADKLDQLIDIGGLELAELAILQQRVHRLVLPRSFSTISASTE